MIILYAKQKENTHGKFWTRKKNNALHTKTKKKKMLLAIVTKLELNLEFTIGAH
jgi:hypothetical protein